MSSSHNPLIGDQSTSAEKSAVHELYVSSNKKIHLNKGTVYMVCNVVQIIYVPIQRPKETRWGSLELR